MDRRLRLSLIAALVAVVLAGGALVVTHGRHRTRDVAVSVADHGSTTTTSSSSTTTTDETTSTAAATASTVVLPPATTTPPRHAASTTTTTAALGTTTTTAAPGPDHGTAIRRCAQVDASTPDGLSAQVCQEGASVAGEPTSLHLTASDGDARVDDDCSSPDFEWGDGPTPRCMIACRMTDAPSGPSSIDTSRDDTYASPGTYDVTVTVESNCGDTAHGGESRTLTLQLVIKDPNQPPDGTG